MSADVISGYFEGDTVSLEAQATDESGTNVAGTVTGKIARHEAGGTAVITTSGSNPTIVDFTASTAGTWTVEIQMAYGGRTKGVQQIVEVGDSLLS